jgi:hypothetical protein
MSHGRNETALGTSPVGTLVVLHVFLVLVTALGVCVFLLTEGVRT